ncbi:MAG: hypothetical protein AB8G05_16360 [Oligoflexales bacterium]
MISLAKCILILSAVNAQSFTAPNPQTNIQSDGLFTEVGRARTVIKPLLAESSQISPEADDEDAKLVQDKALLICGGEVPQNVYEGTQASEVKDRKRIKVMSLLLGINIAKSLALYPLDTLRLQAMNHIPRGSGNLFGGAGMLIPVIIAYDVLVNRLYVQIRNQLQASSIKGAGLLTSVASTCISRVISTPFANIKRIIAVKNLSLLAASQYTLTNNAYVGFIPALSASLLGMSVYDSLYEISKDKLEIKPEETIKNGLLGLGTAVIALAGSYPLVWLQNEVAAGNSANFIEIFKNLAKKDPFILPTLFRGFGKTALLIAVEGVVVSINRSIFDDKDDRPKN